MEAIANSALEETHYGGASSPNPEFAYKSGARPLDGYTIKRGLGWGGFGEVYYALSDGGKEVALKLVQRHLDVELRGVAQCLNLKHSNLLQIFDVRKSASGENWIIMEYISGPSLQHRIADAGAGMPHDELLAWLDGLAAAIDFLHQQGVVHRDLKPGNVFREGGVVKVGDYGLSKFISASRRSGQTQSVGTVHYMAPEISTGNYGKNVDVYSAAVIAFEMLSGDVPFDGETTGEVLMKHLTAEPALEKVAEPFRPIFAKSLAKEPKDRYQSVRELFDAVRAEILGPQASVAAPPPPAAPAPIAKPAIAPPLGLSIPAPPGTFKAKRRSASDFCWTLFQAGLLSMILPVLVLTADIMFDFDSIDLVRGYVSLMVMSGVGSFGILTLARVWEKSQMDAAGRRLTMLLFGLAMGAAALGVNVFLYDQVPTEIKPIVAAPVFDEESIRKCVPVLLVYTTLFALVFAIPDWGKSTMARRAVRFSIWRATWLGALAMIVGAIFRESTRMSPEPFWVASALACTTITVQWVSKFEPIRSRPRNGVRHQRPA